MTNLARLQRGFQRHVLGGDIRFERQVPGTAQVPAGRRLAIYRNAYKARIVEALRDDYPGVRALAGETAFERIAHAYVEAYPSRFRNLRWYGGDLDSFVKRFSRRRGHVLAEMARFEWELSLAFDAADAACVEIADIAQVPPERWPRMQFSLHPSARLIHLYYNVPALITGLQKGIPLPAVRRSRTAVCWLIWRQDLICRFRSLARDEALALTVLLRGGCFSEICAELSDSSDPALRAAALLKRWIIDGLIASTRMRDS